LAKLSNMMITLPVILLPFAAVAAKPAMAATVGHLEAVEILAKSEAAAAKCRTLSGSERTELKQYAARAEVAMAQRYGSSVAHQAVVEGRASGAAAKCGAATAAQTREALEAARVAVAQLKDDRTAPKRVSLFSKKPTTVRLSAQPVIVRSDGVRTAPIGSLSRFKSHATAYYIEQRCRFLPYSKAKTLYRSVLKGQNAAIAAIGAKPVKNALKQARSSAFGAPCDGSSARLVRSAYATIASN
jgi:hypothetical protein